MFASWPGIATLCTLRWTAGGVIPKIVIIFISRAMIISSVLQENIIIVREIKIITILGITPPAVHRSVHNVAMPGQLANISFCVKFLAVAMYSIAAGCPRYAQDSFTSRVM
jgi:hypothetical protein